MNRTAALFVSAPSVRFVRFALGALGAVGLFGCTGLPARHATHYGAPLSTAKAIALTDVLATPDAYAGKPVVVDGKVRAACSRKGCWMELASSLDKGTPGCRVTFKDYGFFVPTNAAGTQARVEGQVAVTTIPAAEVAHYESEGGAFAAKQSDGSAREVRIVATGVELVGLK